MLFGSVNIVEIAVAGALLSFAIRTTSSQWMLRLALLWLVVFALAHGIFVVDRTLPHGWVWKLVEISPALVFEAISLLRRESQRLDRYPWARGSSGSNGGGNP